MPTKSDAAAHLLQPVKKFESMPVFYQAVLNYIQTVWHNLIHGLVLWIQYFFQVDLLQRISERQSALRLFHAYQVVIFKDVVQKRYLFLILSWLWCLIKRVLTNDRLDLASNKSIKILLPVYLLLEHDIITLTTHRGISKNHCGCSVV